jgi:hypothetical protein
MHPETNSELGGMAVILSCMFLQLHKLNNGEGMSWGMYNLLSGKVK